MKKERVWWVVFTGMFTNFLASILRMFAIAVFYAALFYQILPGIFYISGIILRLEFWALRAWLPGKFKQLKRRLAAFLDKLQMHFFDL